MGTPAPIDSRPPDTAPAAPTPDNAAEAVVSLRDLALYFLKLGAFGFGGPIALAGYMQRDLQEEKHWMTHEEYQDGLAIAQTMPGPLAAQLAMWIGFIRHGVLGATLVGVLFVLPPFIVVVAVAALYAAFEGLPQIRALFYGIGPAAIAIIVLAAWKLAKTTDGKDWKLWGVSAILMAITVVTRTELAWLFVVAGILGIAVYAPPWRGRLLRAKTPPITPPTLPEEAEDIPPPAAARPAPPGAPPGTPLLGALPQMLGQVGQAMSTTSVGTPALAGAILITLTLYFMKAAAFTFGSGLAIVPFLHEGVVDQFHWLDERQFLDAVAVGLITPGPVVIMAAFVGYLVAGVAGACLAAFGIFFPVWAFNVAIGRLFLQHRNNVQVRGFVRGATAAAVGAIAGAAVVLGIGAIVDPVTIAVFLAALALLYFMKLKEPYVVGLAGLTGLLLYRA